MKTLLILLTVLLISFNSIESTSISSNYDIFKGYCLGLQYENYTIAEFTDKPDMLMCIVECNRQDNCTVAIYDEDDRTCLLYSIFASVIFGEANDLKESAVKKLPNLEFLISPSAVMKFPNLKFLVNLSAILSANEILKVYELAKLSENTTLQLLYRATRDNFSAAAFHEKCDGHLKTLTIVQAHSGYVFGGFTTQSWTSCNCEKTDNSAFILSLRRNVTGFNVSTDARRFNLVNNNHAISAYINHGPIFGCLNSEFFISDMSNTNNDSYMNIQN